MDNDDVYHDLDKFDKAAHGKKFDSDESDKDEKERARMKKKLQNKQKKQNNKTKGDDVDINKFIVAAKDAAEADENEDDDVKHEPKAKLSKKEKRKQKKQHHEEAETQDEEKKVEATRKKSRAEDDKHPEWPIEVYYCPSCTVPAEYCSFVSRDLEACKEILKKSNSSLYGVIYEGREEELVEESKGKKKKNKNLTTKKEITKDTEIKITKFKRGGKKMVTQISGLDSFGINLKDFSKKLGKKFA